MDYDKRLDRVLDSSELLRIDSASRIAFLSDCHRGDGSWADNFARNQSVYCAALGHYFDGGYTYVEIGDGDELWENGRIAPVISAHRNVFELLDRFRRDGRLVMLYGNHDMAKSRGRVTYRYYDPRQKRCAELLEGIDAREGIAIEYEGKKMLAVHGHQADFLNSALWKLARFLVRHFWRPLELLGFKDPTSASKNDRKRLTVESRLSGWAQKRGKMIIAGHTHKPAFPEPGSPLYFNDGCCVHPNSITAIEISGGEISLVKWHVKAGKNGILFAGKDVTAGPVKIRDFFGAGGNAQDAAEYCD